MCACVCVSFLYLMCSAHKKNVQYVFPYNFDNKFFPSFYNTDIRISSSSGGGGKVACSVVSSNVPSSILRRARKVSKVGIM